ncbi:TPA: hypothetical protein DF272_02580 [Candidatus Falkowbacteria bacterium]|nr:hypothetical protein [Candidatus Falkowbacteria bacterium]
MIGFHLTVPGRSLSWLQRFTERNMMPLDELQWRILARLMSGRHYSYNHGKVVVYPWKVLKEYKCDLESTVAQYGCIPTIDVAMRVLPQPFTGQPQVMQLASGGGVHRDIKEAARQIVHNHLIARLRERHIRFEAYII